MLVLCSISPFSCDSRYPSQEMGALTKTGLFTSIIIIKTVPQRYSHKVITQLIVNLWSWKLRITITAYTVKQKMLITRPLTTSAKLLWDRKKGYKTPRIKVWCIIEMFFTIFQCVGYWFFFKYWPVVLQNCIHFEFVYCLC